MLVGFAVGMNGVQVVASLNLADNDVEK